MERFTVTEHHLKLLRCACVRWIWSNGNEQDCNRALYGPHLAGATTARAETPDEWIKLLTRVHGGFGSFLPVGIRIGEDAMKRLDAKPRELSVMFYQGESTPCPCAADGVSLAVYASAGQGSLQIAAEKSPPGTFAVVVIRPRKGGEGLKYTVPMSVMPKLGQINSTITDARGRYDAVMAIPDLYSVEAVK